MTSSTRARERPAPGTVRRILVEPSDLSLRNVGDTAMMQVAITRLGELWPSARIQVFSDVPGVLPSFCPNAEPLDAGGRRLWFDTNMLPWRIASRVPRRFRRRLRRLEKSLRERWPAAFSRALRTKLRRAGRTEEEQRLAGFVEAVSGAEVVIAPGMGGITDAFPKYAVELLDVFRYAQTTGAITAMFGQGIGPLEDPALRAIAKAVLPTVDLIAVREDRATVPLLRELGVSGDRVVITGDDAIEPAYEARAEALGTGIGVNVRAANYAGVEERDLAGLRNLIQGAARTCGAPLVPIPISCVPGEKDCDTILQLLVGYPTVGTPAEDLVRPEEVMRQLRHCRIVVAGSYHAGVFALSQGIPAIGLARSAYYRDKFLGLKDQFGPGCDVLDLDDPEFAAKLRAAMSAAWESADGLRPGLLAAATRQIAQGHGAYESLRRLVGDREGAAG